MALVECSTTPVRADFAVRYPVFMADIFDVIADTTRRDILRSLLESSASHDSSDGELSVGQLVAKLALSQPTVSKHLKVLRDSNLVKVRERGQHRYYSLETAPLSTIDEWLAAFLRPDSDSEPEVDSPLAEFAPFPGWPTDASSSGALVESLQHTTEVGASIGRRVADASFQARTAFEDATAGVQSKVITPIRRVLGR